METSIQPRGLSKEDAASYSGCKTVAAFDDWISRGIMPGPIPGTHRWDRKAIDSYLDRASGLTTTMGTALEDWKAKRDARSPQRREHV
jgi:hypothetical protein